MNGTTHHAVSRRSAFAPLPTATVPARRRGRSRHRPRAATAKPARTGAPRGRMLALASAMLWTFLLVLHWELSGPDTVGLALYAALALVSAVAYLWPGTVFRTASRFAGTSWEDDG